MLFNFSPGCHVLILTALDVNVLIIVLDFIILTTLDIMFTNFYCPGCHVLILTALEVMP